MTTETNTQQDQAKLEELIRAVWEAGFDAGRYGCFDGAEESWKRMVVWRLSPDAPFPFDLANPKDWIRVP